MTRHVAKPLRYVFVMLHPGYVRNYEQVLRRLLDRGHSIHLAFLNATKQSSDRIAEGLLHDYPLLVTFGRAKKVRRSGWRNLRWTLWLMADYSRYLHPRFHDAAMLRARVVAKARGSRRSIGLVLTAATTVFMWATKRVSHAGVSEALVRFFLRIEHALPTSAEVDKTLSTLKPDVLLTTPHLAVGSQEPEYLKSARRNGIRTGLCVASWDNLTNKGVVKESPDRVFVWNSIQVREATEMHGIEEDRVVMTGAQRFDEWFEQRPTWSRDDFCRMVGLNPAQPFVLYLCSSPFIAADEVSFVRRLVAAMREHPSEEVRGASVLIRPHPQNAEQWLQADTKRLRATSVWPRAGAQPIDRLSRAGFYDSIHHCAAVVGINTSAQIEAGIVGRTVHTVLDSAFEGTQGGTLHFHYLLHENGGLMHLAPDVPALLDDLRRAIAGELTDDGRTERFIKSFVRPHGLDIPATPLLADALEALGRLPGPDPIVPSRGQRVVKALLTPLALVSGPPDRDSTIRILRRRRASVARVTPTENKASEADKHLVRDVKRKFRDAVRSDGQIIVGPWVGSAADELVYWIPCLRWAANNFQIPPSRIIAVSRGGVGLWYAGLADDYMDVVDLVGPDGLERAAAAAEAGDRSALRSVRAAARATAVSRFALESQPVLIDPAILKLIFARYRNGLGAMRHAQTHLEPRRCQPARSRGELDLPDRYMAVGTHFCPWFPDTSDNRERLQRIVEGLAQAAPVVVLAEHDSSPLELPRSTQHPVIAFREDSPASALHTRSRLLEFSTGAVGPFGDFSSLAAAHGVSCLSLYSDPGALSWPDVDLGHRFADVLNAPMTLVDVRQIELLADVLRTPQ